MKVCILAAGMGTRIGAISSVLHKALLPLGKQTVISKIINSFPESTEFVIALGNKSDQVRSFLELAHPKVKFEFIEVNPFEGPGSGPGFSLYSCKDFLQEPFLFTACDTLILDEYPSFDENWIGIAAVDDPENWCMAHLDEGSNRVIGLEYKLKNSKAKWAFTGFACIKDYKCFWDNIISTTSGEVEIQVNEGLVSLCQKGLVAHELKWYDTGQWESYQEVLGKFEKGLTFSGKTTEFTYLYGDRVLKLYSDEQKANNFYERAKDFKKNIPKLLGKEGPVLAYSFVEGDLLSHKMNGPVSADFLGWIEMNFWERSSVDESTFRRATEEFYIDKTISRLKSFYAKFGSKSLSEGAVSTINGLRCNSPIEIVMALKDYIVKGALPSTFHGDLHSDNVLVQGAQYFLIDWRESYAGLSCGDRYYDLGKYLHTLDFSVKSMESNSYDISREGGEVNITHSLESRDVDARDEFYKFLKKNEYSLERTELVNALTFLNMSPLYESELALYLYYLGCYKLKVFHNNYKTLSTITG